jgi:hypothetical protein
MMLTCGNTIQQDAGRSRVGAPEHGDLVPQHQQLDVLGGRRSSQQQDQPQNLLEDQI